MMTWLILLFALGGGWVVASVMGMIPTYSLFQRLFVLLGADSTTLSQTTNLTKVILFKNEVTVNMNTILGDLTEADFDGYAARDIAANAWPQSVDPATGDSMLDARPDSTPFLWETTGVTDLPQTIYGWAVVDSTGATLYCAQNLIPPVVLSAVNQSVTIPRAAMRMLAGSVT